MKFWLLALPILVGCNREPSTIRSRNTARSSILLTERYFDLPKELEMQRLAARMVKSNKVILGGVGFSGVETSEYSSYKQLLAIAPDSFWIRLSYSRNPVARVYAFEALFDRKSPDLFSIAERLKNDSSSVEEWSGCVEMPERIDEFVAFKTGDTARAHRLMRNLFQNY
jgi:hypothetical protein